MVENGVPELRAKAHALVAAMDFGFYYDPAVGQLRGGAWTEQPPGCSVAAGRRVDDVQPLRRPELRAADGQLPGHRRRPGPARALLPPRRTFRPTCDVGDFQETQPSGVTRTYLGVDVYEGHYDYRGMHIVPTLGRRHVRGADGPALRARGALGPALVGRQPPALRARADRARPRRGALRLLGLLAQRQPVGRLQRLRRRRDRDAGRRLSLQQRQHVRRPRLRRLPARASPTRRPRPTPTASSRRTPRSWPCATRRAPRSPTSRGCARTSASTARAASTTPSTSTAGARSPAPTSRSTRAWSWPRRPTR